MRFEPEAAKPPETSEDASVRSSIQ